MQKYRLFSLFSLLFFSFSLRYPYSLIHDLEIKIAATDSIVYMYHASIISQYGYNPWILDFFSYFGLYPFSEPFGLITFVVSVSFLTGLEISTTVLILNFFLSMFGLFSMYLFCNLISKDFNFIFSF